jgi:dTDP-4-dehydrorhamnose reductase
MVRGSSLAEIKDINAPISVLLLGSDTELGRALQSYYQNDYDFAWHLVPGHKVISLLFELQNQPDALAAYDAVIDAYSLRHITQNDYRDFSQYLARLMASEHYPLHYMLSGVQVFSGDKDSSYLETDVADAKGKIAKTLIEMENMVALDERHVVLRTGWLFSGHRDDFVCNTIDLMKRGEPLLFNDGSVGCPTPVTDVARVLLSIVKQRYYGAQNAGIYHYCCSEEVSWIGLVEAILTTSSQFEPKANVALERIVDGAAAEGALMAGRRQSLSCRKIFNHFGIKQRSWRPVLRTLIKEYFQGKG